MPYQLTICIPVGATSDTLACVCYVHQHGAIAAGRRAPHYPSDMTDAEWAQVRASMPVPAWLEGRGGRPEAYCHREMVDAVRYLVDNGVKWRAMPVDLPAPRKVYDFFRRWSRHGYVRELHQRLRRLQRRREGRAAEPSAGITDAQSVDGSETCPATTRGIDGNKLRDWRKRHILTDTGGLLLEVTVTPANVHDSVAAPELLEAFMAEPGRLLRLVRARRSRTRSPRTGCGSRSSSAPTGPGDSWCSRAGGRSNAHWAGSRGPGG